MNDESQNQSESVASTSLRGADGPRRDPDRQPADNQIRHKSFSQEDQEAALKWLETVRSEWKEVVEEAFGAEPRLQETAYLMLFGFATQDIRHIIRITINPMWTKEFVAPRVHNARRAGIWRGNGRMSADWMTYASEGKDDEAQIAFIMDVLTMDGTVEKRHDAYRLAK